MAVKSSKGPIGPTGPKNGRGVGNGRVIITMEEKAI